MTEKSKPCICQNGTKEGCTHLRENPCCCSGGPTPPCEYELWQRYWAVSESERPSIQEKLDQCNTCKVKLGI